MISVHYFKDNVQIPPNIACIGCFDGVHRGHQELINKTVKLAKEKNLKPMVITFDPDPVEIFGDGHMLLTTLNERIKLFERFGIEEVLIIHFDEKVMNKSPLEFKEEILDKLNIDTLICGFDFTYGYKGQGNIDSLKKDGVNLIVIPEYRYYGKKISSSRIRKELENKNYNFVNKLLGYENKK